MAYWLILVRFGNSFADYFKKIIAKSTYLARTMIFLANSNAIWASKAGFIVIFDFKLRKLT